MNKPKLLIPFLGLLMLFNNIYADDVYPVAISKYGMLVGKYKITPDAKNSIPDTISLEEAKSIFALNAYYIDKKDGPHKLNISEFQMTIINNIDTTKLISKSEMLSEELLSKIKNLKSGANLYFEGIIARWNKDETMAVILLAFYVK
jgi:hypothetical protein